MTDTAAKGRSDREREAKGSRAGQAGSAERPTCYLLKVNVQLKLSCDGEAVLRAGSSAVAPARPLSRRGAAVQAHVAELYIFSEEKPAICEHQRQTGHRRHWPR